jgi:two-component system probable response regulator PhcQ
MRRLLLIDDDINVLHALHRALRQSFSAAEMRIDIYADPLQALERSRHVTFDVVISDYRMPQMDGVEFLKAFRQLQPDATRLVLSGSTEFNAVMSAINQAEVFRHIAKPWDAAELKEAVQLALARRDEADVLRLHLGELSPQEIEARRLEADEPGITKVKWGADGSVILD